MHYAVLSLNEELGLDDKLHTYPVSGLALGRTRGEILVEAERQELVEQAGTRMLPLYRRLFDPNAIVPDPPFVRASKLLGSAIHNAFGSSAAQVEDLVLNLASGRLRFVVAEIDDRRYALPRHTLTADDKAANRGSSFHSG